MHIKKLIWGEDQEQFLGLARLYCQIWKEPPWNEDFWTVEGVMNDLEEQSQKPNAIVLATTNGNQEIIGFTSGYEINIVDISEISGIPRETWENIIGGDNLFYIDEFGVKKDYRKHGVGGILVQRLLEEIAKRNIRSITLRTDISAIPARKVYSVAGFKELPLRDVAHKDRSYWLKRQIEKKRLP